MQFSLIIPSYNNAHELMRELPPFLEYLKGAGHEVETLVVNDGSSQPESLIEFCAVNGLLLLHHEKNRGKRAAVKTGMQAAKSPVRIFTDADIPFQYNTMDSMLRVFETTNADVVVGDRRKSDYFAKTPLIRRAGSGVFSSLVDLIMLKRMGDTQCGIKGFRATCVDVVFGRSNMNGFAADIEWLHRAQQSGLKIQTVSAEFRNAGASSVVFWKHAILMLRDVLKIRFS
ncbi:MAG: glycosyltransferase [Flavobacteriales bacterium]